jgi:hypothetical protein
VPLKVDVGVGEARVLVPNDVCVATDAEIGMGNVSFLSHDNSGVDVDVEDLPDAPPGATRLLLKGDVGIGELTVRHGEFFDEDFDPLDDSHPRQDACYANGESATG